MRASRMAWAGALALIAIGVSGPRASAQYYGYASGQGPAPSGQVPPPGGGCQTERVGCQVVVCPRPNPTPRICEEINAQIPPIQPVPSCHEAPVCEIVSELAPGGPRTIDIWRNAYVPIRIRVVQAPGNAVPVNIRVNWREVHILCDEHGQPIPPTKAAELLQELQNQMANAPAPPEASAPAAAPAPASAPAPAAPAPVSAAPVPASGPAKRWVFLSGQNVWGYGYQRADGLWVIDQGSKRPSPPSDANAAPTSADNSATGTATRS